MTSIERNIAKDAAAGLQYLTLSRGISSAELPAELKQYQDRPGKGVGVNALVRFDDDCKNGQAFAFPELQPYFKWHLVSTDGPMHYLANATFHAGDLDHNGRAKGEASSFEYGVRFNGVPVTHRIGRKLHDFIGARVGTGDFQVFSIAHQDRPGESYKFQPKYSLVGFSATKWHECPFNDETEANEFCNALNTCKVELACIPTAWSQGKARELDYARNAAVWPEATDEQLSVPKKELTEALEARLPALMVEFRAAVESLGFDYDFPARGRRAA